MKKFFKKLFKFLLILILVIVLGLGALIGWLSATEYQPAPIEPIAPLSDTAQEKLPQGAKLEILSWNIGYAGLGKDSDFVLDGGENMRAADKATVAEYLAGIGATIDEGNYDLVLLQEVDTNSARTYSINEAEKLASGDAFHALNYSCGYVPNPNTYFIDPFGKVHSGLLTCSNYAVEKAERQSLPCPFSWPLRIVNLKRCLLVSYLPIEGSDSQLVLVNLHLEAYDDGEGKIAQTKQLMDFLAAEYQKGNYVIAGGDFNQVFPGALEAYPNTHPENWIPGMLEEGSLPEGFSYVYDLAVPSCRLLNQPYDPADTVNTQHYVIDGLIVSPNVTVDTVETLDLGFENADHNPVHLSVTLG
ncbi:MAG: endonuclease [Oscillospiraceae bacterium]|nr:endonuclease [Oscillospiraceae bacterium]